MFPIAGDIMIKTFSNKYVIIAESVEGCFESRNLLLISEPRPVKKRRRCVIVFCLLRYDYYFASKIVDCNEL